MLGPGDEVRNLLGRYCELIDAWDLDGLGSLFATGVLADERGTVLAAGAEAVRTFYASTVQLHRGSPRTKHLVANTVLDIDGGSIVARSSYVVIQAIDGRAPDVVITGRYVDRFTVGPDGWRFAERRFSVDQVGDLSRHLAGPSGGTPEDATDTR